MHLCRLLANAGPDELKQVVGQADQLTLCGGLAGAAEGEPSEATALLGLAEDRLDDRLAAPVDRAPLGRAQLLPHSFREPAPRSPGRRRRGAPLRVPVRRDGPVAARRFG